MGGSGRGRKGLGRAGRGSGGIFGRGSRGKQERGREKSEEKEKKRAGSVAGTGGKRKSSEMVPWGRGGDKEER